MAGRKLRLIRLRDPESGATVVADASSPSVRVAWSGVVASWQEQSALAIDRAGADRIDVALGDDAAPELSERHLLEPLQRFFRRRDLRGTPR